MDNALGILAGIGVLVAGIGFGYSQLKLGSGKAKDDVIATYKESIQAEKEKSARLAAEVATLTDSHQQQINELNNKLGKLQGLYEASETSKKEYLSILQGRDPAQQKFMETLMKAASKSDVTTDAAAKYMSDTTNALGQILEFMKTLNSTANNNMKFLNAVVKDTASQEGHFLRKK